MDYIRRHCAMFHSNYPRRPGTGHHYVFDGKVHVRVAALLIITVRVFLTIVFALHYLTSNEYGYKRLDATYEIVEFLTVTMLVIGFVRKESIWMWPFMAVEFTWVIVVIIMATIGLVGLIFPPSTTQSIVFVPSLRLALLAYLFAILSSIEIYVMLACNRYFDDEKTYRQAPTARPIIRNQARPSSSNASVPGPNTDHTSFQNPNFIPDNAVSLDMDDLDEDENSWHRADARAGVIA
uniref:MARVEL domain-containing protein n=1 Tax=Panagrellus redivivus TaxID=6233 RepID=A0A7E4W6C6_PANRE